MQRTVMMFNRKPSRRNKGADQTGAGDIETKYWERSVRNGAR